MQPVLKGSWSLILGASAGMGRACALALADAGSNIIGVHLDSARNQPAIDELVGQLRERGVQVHFHNDNAASEPGRSRVMAQVRDVAGDAGVRVLLHSLAFGSLVPFLPPAPGQAVPGGSAASAEASDPAAPGAEAAAVPAGTATRAQMDMTLSVMAHSLVYWTQDLLAAGLLRSGSKIYAMTSSGTARVARSYGMVSAAKSALESHVRQLAVELAPYGVGVNAIRAGITLTESFLRIPESAELSERARVQNPHGRLTTPEDVAEAIVLLAQARSSWLTGNVIGVDGGEILTV